MTRDPAPIAVARRRAAVRASSSEPAGCIEGPTYTRLGPPRAGRVARAFGRRAHARPDRRCMPGDRGDPRSDVRGRGTEDRAGRRCRQGLTAAVEGRRVGGGRRSGDRERRRAGVRRGVGHIAAGRQGARRDVSAETVQFEILAQG
jgi:hypothetical protein